MRPALREPHEWVRRFDRAIWAAQGATTPSWKVRLLHGVRIAAVVVRDISRGDLTLWSMSLVYTTLLSIVPLLALCFSVLKAFGVRHQIEPLLANVLSPLGEQAQELTARLVVFIERMNVGVLGAVGLGTLIYTVVSLMQKIEGSFNAIWHVEHLRSFGERFTRYLSALLVGPLLVFVALGITAMALNSELMRSMLDVPLLGSVVKAASRLVPYALVIGAFTFMYFYIPNTRVRAAPAFIAGIVGGALWQSAGWAFAAFVASSTNYAAIYSSFAILLLFLIWLYVSWLVMLIGVSVSFYLQHPEYLYAAAGEPRLSNRMRERVALACLEAITTHFVAGGAAWTLPMLTHRLNVPMHSIRAVLESLEAAGLLTRTADDPPAWLPARDPSKVLLTDVLAVIRGAGEDRFLNPDALALSSTAQDAVTRIDRAVEASLDGLTLRSLADGRA